MNNSIESSETSTEKVFPIAYDYRTLRRVNKIADSGWTYLVGLALSGAIGFAGGFLFINSLRSFFVPDPDSLNRDNLFSLSLLITLFFMGSALIIAFITRAILEALFEKFFVDRYDKSFSGAYELNEFINNSNITYVSDSDRTINFLGDFYRRVSLLAPGEVADSKTFTSNQAPMRIVRTKEGILFEVV